MKTLQLQPVPGRVWGLDCGFLPLLSPLSSPQLIPSELPHLSMVVLKISLQI